MAFFDTCSSGWRRCPACARPGWCRRCRCAAGTCSASKSRDGRQRRRASEPSANHRVVSPDYFQTLGIPLAARPPVSPHRPPTRRRWSAVVDDAFVRKHFPDEDPIGRQSTSATAPPASTRSSASSANVHHDGLDATADADDVRAVQAGRVQQMWMLARTDGDPARLSGAARQARARDRSGRCPRSR